MEEIVMETNIPAANLIRRGKVRDIYEFGELLLIVATDRISAFDVVLPDGIPGKGKVLTRISTYWFNETRGIIENHLVQTDVERYPEALRKYSGVLKDRSMLVKKASPLLVECIARGYLSGSGWKEYGEKGTVCGIKLPAGLFESSRIPEPVFTPSTKAEQGHDINITFEEMKRIVGGAMAERLKTATLEIYKKAVEMAEKKGIIIADTKLEFGIYEDKLILIDELLTPDSSRFWSKKDYSPGKGQDSFDKQIVRDYLVALRWDKTPPAPHLPEEVVEKTAARYAEILRILTG
jgi:phosphoribosylaminoimidazole-succinocarboxamide synthase